MSEVANKQIQNRKEKQRNVKKSKRAQCYRNLQRQRMAGALKDLFYLEGFLTLKARNSTSTKAIKPNLKAEKPL